MQSYSTTEIRVTITKMDTGDYIGLNFDCITQCSSSKKRKKYIEVVILIQFIEHIGHYFFMYSIHVCNYV